MGVPAKLCDVTTFEGFSQIEIKRIRAAIGDYDMPTSSYWCGVMFRARDARMTQTELGQAIGTTQTTISEIEKGKVSGSKYVPAICVALGIPLPIMFAKDEFDERWLEVGRYLRARSMKRFLHYLAIMEEEAGVAVAEADDQPEAVEFTDAPPERRRLRPAIKPD
jgi:DNA-binding XRE family transcriptional regulator